MKTLTFTLNEEEAELTLRGLGELPAKFSIDLIGKIQKQAREQLTQTEEKCIQKLES